MCSCDFQRKNIRTTRRPIKPWYRVMLVIIKQGTWCSTHLTHLRLCKLGADSLLFMKQACCCGFIIVYSIVEINTLARAFYFIQSAALPCDQGDVKVL